jgi:GNAT superfamily N-acetyltransferase
MSEPLLWRRGKYQISTDTARVELSVVHGFLSSSYWAEGIPLEVVSRSLEHSLCFGLYESDMQVGFARVVTDHATFAYLCDVFVADSHRGRGLGKWMMETVIAHPDLQGLRRWLLATRDAHNLYRQFGFTALDRPEIFMERHAPDVYKRRGTTVGESYKPTN